MQSIPGTNADKSALKRSFQSGLRRVHMWCARRELPERMALYLHSLDPAEQPAVRAMLQWCRDHARTFVDTDRYLAPDCPAGVVNVSFDDNHRGWHDALPVFEEFGVMVTFYMNTCVLRGSCSAEEMHRYYDLVEHHGRREPLTVGEIAEIHRAGHLIGAHTHSHLAMKKVPLEHARADLERNRAMLEEITGAKVSHFSYPFGVRRHFSPALGEMVRRMGFQSIAAATPGLLYKPRDPFWLQRTYWMLDKPVAWNAENLRVNGALWVKLTKLSPIG